MLTLIASMVSPLIKVGLQSFILMLHHKFPYIQNCTNFADSGISNATQAENSSNYFNPNNVTQGGFGGDLTSGPTGGGLFIDGFAVSSSSPSVQLVVDSFTQITLDGPGILATNNAYAQLVSFFGTFCHYHTKLLMEHSLI